MQQPGILTVNYIVKVHCNLHLEHRIKEIGNNNNIEWCSNDKAE